MRNPNKPSILDFIAAAGHALSGGQTNFPEYAQKKARERQYETAVLNSGLGRKQAPGILGGIDDPVSLPNKAQNQMAGLLSSLPSEMGYPLLMRAAASGGLDGAARMHGSPLPIQYAGPDGKPVFGYAQQDRSGSWNIANLPGEAQFLDPFGKSYMSQSGTESAKNRYQPAREEDIALRRAGVEAATKPAIEADVTRARVGAQNQADAAAGLGSLEADANEALIMIDRLRKSPGLPKIVGGAWQVYAPNMPGGEAADAEFNRQQLQAKAFKQAFESLKGGGSITQTEGEAATRAIVQLERAQSLPQFKQALGDLERILKQGLARARRKAGSSTRTNQPQKENPLGLSR